MIKYLLRWPRIGPAYMVVSLGGLLHAVWGALLLVNPEAHGATSIHQTTVYLGSTSLAGILYLLVALLAIVAVHVDAIPVMVRFLLVAPQQFLFVASAGYALTAILGSSYADGVIRPWAFIAADQVPYVLLAAWHTFALIFVAFRR